MKKTKKLVLAAMFCAFCCIGTMIHIPAGPTLGYVHLGDAFVLLSGVLLGPVTGGLSAAIGSSLADLVNGYAIWIPGTFVTKGFSAVICSLLFCSLKKMSSKGKKSNLRNTFILSGIFGELVMLVGYFCYEVLLLMMSSGSHASLSTACATSLMNVPFNLIQALFAIVLIQLILPILLRIEDVRNIIHKK